jgi:aspartyl/asparaginyl beta-hydroxylase (cupin superfamily)
MTTENLSELVQAADRAKSPAEQRESIDAALALDPYFIPAHLAKGQWLEQFGDANVAAIAYQHALKISPPEHLWPADFRSQLERAREIVDKRGAALSTHLSSELADLQDSLPAALNQRWNEAISIRAGMTKPYISDSNQLYVPRLPAIPFFERDDFPFLAELEDATNVIREELTSALDNNKEAFTPYINYNDGEPVNQWQNLNHSDRWSAFHLYQGGLPVDENLSRCPETAKILSRLPLAGIDGLCPNVLFSALAPHTHIPPHNGECNARLVAHLPLIVPDNCLLRVGFEERHWETGEVLIFDDTLEHEARNDSDQLRVVLIFDVWNPLLTETEKLLVSRLAKATRQFDMK